MRLRPPIPLHLGFSLFLAFFFWSLGALPVCFGEPESKLLKSFGSAAAGGAPPFGRPMQSSDGYLYGTTYFGGRENAGCLYRCALDGSDFRVLAHFSLSSLPAYPTGPLIEAGDGFLYGTAVNEDSFKSSTEITSCVYRFDRITRKIEVAGHLPGLGRKLRPGGGVIEASDGRLYGATDAATSSAGNLIYSMNRDGTDFKIVTTIPSSTGTPSSDYGNFNHLLEGWDGKLYGSYRTGRGNNSGLVFSASKDGSDVQIHSEVSAGGLIEASDGALYGLYQDSQTGGIFRALPFANQFEFIHTFDFFSNGVTALGTLVEAADGKLLGAKSKRSQSEGELFSINPDGTGFSVLAALTSAELQARPDAGVVLAGNEWLFGLAKDENNGYFIYRANINGGECEAIHSFTKSGGQPAYPQALVEGTDGWFYGTHEASDVRGPGFFKIKPNGTQYTYLREFETESGAARTEPQMGLLALGPDGWFYGTTRSGGDFGGGSVFKISPDGSSYEVLWSFIWSVFRVSEEPLKPLAGVLVARDGYIYGASEEGGPEGNGTLFRLKPDGTEKTVIFHLPPGRLNYWSTPIEGSDGKLYGGARYGFYSIAKDGTGFVRHTLHEIPMGSGDTQFLTEAADGYIYGLVSTGGSGFIYKTHKDGSGYQYLHGFRLPGSGGGVGAGPYNIYGRLVEGGDGFMYGSSTSGGAHGHGVIFRVPMEGEGLEIVHDFDLANGDGAAARFLTKGGDGGIYGALSEGGEFGVGALFRYGEPLPDPPRLVVRAPDGTPIAAGGTFDLGAFEEIVSMPKITLTLANEGGEPLVLADFMLNDPASAFSMMLPATTVVAPGETSAVEVTFRVYQTGSNSATLSWTANDPDAESFSVKLEAEVLAPVFAIYNGTGEDAPEIIIPEGAMEPVVIELGEARRGSVLGRDFRVANLGTKDLLIVESPVAGSHRLATALPLSIRPGSVAVIRVERDTSLLGPVSDQTPIQTNDHLQRVSYLRFSSTVIDPEIAVHNGPDTLSAELAAGQAAAVDFGRVIQGTVGGAAAKALTIANTGTAPLAVSAISVPAGYTLLAGEGLAMPALIEPGASGTWTLTLSSIEARVHAGSVVISSDDLDEAEFVFPVTGEIYIPAPTVAVANQETTLNRQTGLREQTIRVVNDTTATVPAYRLLISGLPAGVTVANASEVRADGSVVVLVRQPLAPFSSFDLVLEYASANRQPVTLDPLIITEAVLEPPDDGAGEGEAAFEIERAVWLPESGGLLLEFGSAPGRLYAVEYSDDGAAWKASPATVRGAGNRTQWIDRGPPRTASPPGAQPLRFYRVRALAD